MSDVNAYLKIKFSSTALANLFLDKNKYDQIITLCDEEQTDNDMNYLFPYLRLIRDRRATHEFTLKCVYGDGNMPMKSELPRNINDRF